MSRSKKEDLQNEETWWRMGAELLFARSLFSHMLEYQEVIPKTLWLHKYFYKMENHLDEIRYVAANRMEKAGGFDPKTADDCFFPTCDVGEREAIGEALKKALEVVSEVAANAMRKYHEEESKHNDTP